MKILVLCIFISSFTFLQAQKIEVREIKVSDQENVNVKEVGDSAVGDLEFEDMAIPLAVVEQVPLFSSCEKTVTIWDLVTLEVQGTLKCHKDEVRAIHVHGDYIFTGGKGTANGGSLLVWDLRKLNPNQAL